MYKLIKQFFVESYHRPSAKILHFLILFKKFLFNKNTNIFSERILLLKNPPQSVVYYNSFGRIINLFLNFINIILLNKFFEKGVDIESNKIIEEVNKKKGNDNFTWPLQAIHNYDTYEEIVNDDFLNKIQNEYFESIKIILENKKFRDSDWWKKCRDEFREIFFLNNKINEKALKNFRNNISTSAEILNDQNFLKKENGNIINKVKACLLINLYHKLSDHISLDILRMASDSKVGENLCLNYREQRINQRILRYAYYTSQIKKNTDLKKENRNLVLDIGGGYGGLIRFLKNTYLKSTFVLIELPELCMLACYFLKRNFSNKNKISIEDLRKYDFVILPQNFMEKFEDDVFDLIINTTSLGEMTDEMQDYYLENIERCSNKYFYSVNRSKKRVEKYNSRGFYDFNFKNRWISNVYKYTHTYHIEFLGEKIKK
jgi:putative sugar O-methyltransferase